MATSRLRGLLTRMRSPRQQTTPPPVPVLPRAFGDDKADILCGVICIPDVSGYTGLVSTVDLVHAHEIVTRLMKRILAAGWQIMQVSKLIGDAVLLYRADVTGESGADIQRRVLETVRSMYAGFVEELLETQQDRHECGCGACQGVPTLDLKFVIHYGEYMVYDLQPFRELMGREVILAFRLLKNDVPVGRYALMTDSFLRLDSAIDAHLVGAVDQTYEHLGTLCIGWIDPAVGS